MKNIIACAGILFSALLFGASCKSSNHSDHTMSADTISNMPPPAGDTAMMPPADTLVPRSNINSDTPVMAR